MIGAFCHLWSSSFISRGYSTSPRSLQAACSLASPSSPPQQHSRSPNLSTALPYLPSPVFPIKGIQSSPEINTPQRLWEFTYDPSPALGSQAWHTRVPGMLHCMLALPTPPPSPRVPNPAPWHPAHCTILMAGTLGQAALLDALDEAPGTQPPPSTPHPADTALPHTAPSSQKLPFHHCA